LWADDDDLLSQEGYASTVKRITLYIRMCTLQKDSFIYVYPVWTMELCAAEDIQWSSSVLGTGIIFVTIMFVCVKSVI
jgi:hypothetical protein